MESSFEAIKENFMEHCDREDTHREKSEVAQREMMKLLYDVRDKQAKMSGFWAGTAFVISALATGLTVFFTRH